MHNFVKLISIFLNKIIQENLFTFQYTNKIYLDNFVTERKIFLLPKNAFFLYFSQKKNAKLKSDLLTI